LNQKTMVVVYVANTSDSFSQSSSLPRAAHCRQFGTTFSLGFQSAAQYTDSPSRALRERQRSAKTEFSLRIRRNGFPEPCVHENRRRYVTGGESTVLPHAVMPQESLSRSSSRRVLSGPMEGLNKAMMTRCEEVETMHLPSRRLFQPQEITPDRQRGLRCDQVKPEDQLQTGIVAKKPMRPTGLRCRYDVPQNAVSSVLRDWGAAPTPRTSRSASTTTSSNGSFPRATERL